MARGTSGGHAPTAARRRLARITARVTAWLTAGALVPAVVLAVPGSPELAAGLVVLAGLLVLGGVLTVPPRPVAAPSPPVLAPVPAHRVPDSGTATQDLGPARRLKPARRDADTTTRHPLRAALRRARVLTRRMVMPAAPRPPRPLSPSTRWSRGPLRALAALVAVALTALVAGAAAPVAVAADGDAFTITVGEGSPAVVTGNGTTPLAPVDGAAGTYDLPVAQNDEVVRFTFVANCVLEDEQCADATAQLELGDLRLSSTLTPPPAAPGGVGYTVAYLDADGGVVADPAANLASVAALLIEFVSYGADGQPGPLEGGNILDFAVDATVVPPAGGGEQTGRLTVTPSANGATQTASETAVRTTFVPVLGSSTDKSWVPATPYLSGAADTARTAVIAFANTGDTASGLVVDEPADPAARPSGTDAFNLLQMTAVRLDSWPAGATSLTITTWRDGAVAATTTVPDLASAQAWLAALPAADLAATTGLRLAFSGVLEQGAAGALSVDTTQLPAGNDTAGRVTGRNGSVAYEEAGGAPAGGSSDFHTVAVSNTARTTVTSTVPDAAPGTSQDAADLRIWDPYPYAGSTKTFVAPGTGAPVDEVYPGGFAVARLTGTNWTRQAVDSLVLVDQPDPAGDAALAAALDASGGVDADMFSPTGLVLAGFGTDVAGGEGDGQGLVWPDGATGVTITLRAGGEEGTWTAPAGSALPTTITAFDFAGDPAWSDVTGLEVAFTGAVAMGASATVPYLVTTGPDAAVEETTANVVLARTTVDGLTSDPTPRTPASGNRPLSRDSLLVSEPYAAATITKTIPESSVEVPGGTVTSVLRAAAGTGTDTPTTLVIEDSARAPMSATAWWQRFAPTGVDVTAEGDVTTTVEYYDTVSGGAPVWTAAPTPPWGAGTTGSWLGVRVVATKDGGARFDAGEVVQAVVRFVVHVDSGVSFPDGQTVQNCAVAQAVLDYGGTTPSVRETARACDQVVGYTTSGSGPAALVKNLDTDVVEGSTGAAGTRTATLTWGTAGRDDLTSVTVSDENTAGDGSVRTGRTGSFWDTFDLVSVRPVSSGPTPEAGRAYDPYLAFDQVSDVEVYDTVDGRWVSLAAEQWAGGAWGAAGTTRGDVTFGGQPRAQFPYAGSFPGMTVVDETLRARVGAVRLEVTALTPAQRDQVATALAAAGDWRVPTVSDALVDGAVAGTAGPARQIQLDVRLRSTSRAEPALVVNDAATYNAGSRSLVVDDARVTATGGSSPFDAVGAANGAGYRTVTLLPTTVTAAATKSWTRASENPEDITGDPEHVHTVPLQEDGGDAPEATLAVTTGNASGIPVDSLTVTEPQGIDDLVGEQLDADAPFAWFAATRVGTLTSAAQLAGATGLTVTGYVLDADGRVADQVLTVTDTGAAGLADDLPAALAAEGLDLADLVGLRLEYAGRIAPQAQAGLQLVTTLREANAVTGETPADHLRDLPADEVFRVTNTAHVAVADRLVCTGAPESYGADGTCTPAPDATTATDHVIIQQPQVQAFASKRFDSPSTVTRDAGTPVVAVLDVQNFGNSEADRLSLTDADPTFFDAVALSEARLLSLPTGAESATLEVLLRSADLTVGADGAYTGPVAGAWTPAGTLGQADIAAGTATWTPPAGAAWSDVIGVRVVFADTDGDRIATPGAALGTVRLTGALRTELLSGGLPAASGADPAWQEQPRNPGETADATVANTVVAQAERGSATGTEDAATASFRVAAGTQQVTLTKTSPAPPSGGWTPGSLVPYTITVTNSGTADVVGPVVTDRLPADDTLSWTGGVDVASSDPGLGEPAGAPQLDEATGTVVLAWPATARLSPGQDLRVTLTMRISEAPSSLTIVNAAAVTAAGRPLVGAPAGNGGTATCRPGSSFEDDGSGAGACVTTTPALSMNASNVFLSEKWVSTGSTAATSTTDAACAPRGAGADATWFRYPCVAPVAPGGTMTWQVQVRSMADAATPTVTVVDMLPRPGDYQAMKTSGRGSQWRPVWDGTLPAVVPVTGVAGVTSRTDGVARYYVTTADYAAGALPASTSYDPVPDAWTEVTAAMSPQDAARVTGFKVVLDYTAAGNFTKNSAVRLQWAMRAPVTGAPDDAVAWNSFAFRVEPEGRAPLASVPLKAGVAYRVPSTLFAVGDRVWHDVDRDGVQDADEPPVAGVTVTLLAADGTELGSTTTAADGSYLFDRLAAGDYRVAFSLPAELAARYRFTTPVVGDAARDSDAVSGPGEVTIGRSAVFTLDEGAPGTTPVSDPDVDADHLNPTLDAGLVDAPLAIGDHVWLDADHDGVQDAGEQPLGGVTVRLLDADGAELATTTTDADGWYAFGGLDAGDYVVEFVRPDGYRFSRPVQGGDGAADSDADRSSGRSAVVHLRHGGPGVRPTTDAERAALAAAGTDAGSIDPTVDAGLFLEGVAGPVTDLAVRKDAVVVPADGGDPAVAQGGDTVTYTVTVTNRGTVAAEDVVLTDDVPDVLAVQQVDAGSGTPGWATCAVTGQDARGYGGTLRCELADDLLAGQDAPVVTLVTTLDPDVARDTVTNTASVTATNEDPTTTLDNSDDATVRVAWLAATAQPRCTADAPWLDYAVEAHNVDAGSSPITLTWYPDADGDGTPDGPAVASQTLPAGSDLTGSVLWPGAAVDDQGRGIAWPGSRAVQPGETPEWENQVLDPSLPEHALRAGVLVEVRMNPTTAVTAAYPATTPECAVERLPALSLAKTADAAGAGAGDRVAFTLQVDSTGLGATDDVVLTDTLPRTLRVVDVVPAAPAAAGDPRWAGCTVTDRDADGNGGVVTCVLDGWIGQGQTAPAVSVVTTLAADAAGTVTNSAVLAWSDPDTGVESAGTAAAAASVEVRAAGAAGGSTPAGSPLAVTGAQVAGLALVALLLVGGGAAAVVVRRRGVAG